MLRRLILCVGAAVLVFPLVSVRGVPLPIGKGGKQVHPRNTIASQIVGKWNVKFANGVTEVCKIRKDGIASVVEPLRTSGGKGVVKDGMIVIVFDDDRIERWKMVGKQFVVEHWFPGAQFPTGTPVRGIAKRAR
jgi:hypothetical protein